MEPTFFPTPAAFRKWLVKHHRTAQELLVGYYKVNSIKPSISWPESVDQALCFGWIDGVRKSIDAESYSIRFTPRKRTSIWSVVNIRKMAELDKAGLMTSAGLKAFEYRTERRSAVYSYERDSELLDPAFEKLFRQNKVAWTFFAAQAPSYKKVMINWIMTGKQEITRRTRLRKTIDISAQQMRMR